MEYNFKDIESKWQQYWSNNKTYKTVIDHNRPKFYVLDMFPYPSGAGLHVGHPLGYIASDIFSRFKRQNGFNVLHPMGYDAYGLPAEQYAIQTGQHPAITTDTNIKRYREQLDKIGFSYDWEREVKTCEPNYYKWTQWVFIKMFEHYYCNQTKKAQPIADLVKLFEQNGSTGIDAACSKTLDFTAADWKSKSEKEQYELLLNYRIAYLADTMVNWCPALGTVLANDEVKDGLSVRGGHPVEQRVMRQWSLRVSAYAERLLNGLDNIDWSESLKEVQRNWIGRSEGAEMSFKVKGSDVEMVIFTTRADTVYGVTFMVLAPESKLVDDVTTAGQRTAVDEYIIETKKRTERERMADVKKVSGVFSGAYAINPLTNEEIPIWISDYVLAGYGTGAIMAVPAHDTRDFKFARHFNLPIRQVVVPKGETESDPNTWEDSIDSKEGVLVNSGIINGLSVPEAIKATAQYIKQNNLGQVKVNFRLRDAIFSRQRYWGEPFPVYYKDEMACMLPEDQLPLELPEIDKYLPTEKGEPPLGRAKNWQTADGYPLELNTMPGFAGSSAYYLRYMDPTNNNALVSQEANSYWQDVDLYIGGTEHATGHLIYSRFWNKFLFDIGLVVKDEPFKKLINQGMIQGRSSYVLRFKGSSNIYVSLNMFDRIGSMRNDELEDFFNMRAGVKDYCKINNVKVESNREYTPVHVDVNYVINDYLDCDRLKNDKLFFKDAVFIKDQQAKFTCDWAVEKMSKSFENVVNPDDIIDRYGADTLRLYEMFLGPLEQSKPWDTNGIDGVHKFLRKLWRLFTDANGDLSVSSEPATKDELKVVHRTIKRITFDIERFGFNTCVSTFMICVNDLTDLKCNKREALELLVTILAPLAPHVCEELWQMLGNNTSVCDAPWPQHDEAILVESTFDYPVSFNGKTRFKLELPLDYTVQQIEKAALENENSLKWTEGKAIKKIIVVPGKIINVVVG